jgi:hypothetical protein
MIGDVVFAFVLIHTKARPQYLAPQARDIVRRKLRARSLRCIEFRRRGPEKNKRSITPANKNESAEPAEEQSDRGREAEPHRIFREGGRRCMWAQSRAIAEWLDKVVARPPRERGQDLGKLGVAPQRGIQQTGVRWQQILMAQSQAARLRMSVVPRDAARSNTCPVSCTSWFCT